MYKFIIFAFLSFSAMAEPSYYALEKFNAPIGDKADIYGGYANGCVKGAVKMPEDTAHATVMRPQRNRYWGHPDLIEYLQNLSERVAKADAFKGILIGDMSRPVGGPMKSGHKSHQSGLDTDLWLVPMPEKKLSLKQRKTQSAISFVAPNMTLKNGWSDAHRQFVLSAANDPKVARIFINAALKKDICQHYPQKTALLRKIRPWFGHDDHIHVRLSCPKGMASCQNQAPIPAGSGCDTDQFNWWFSDEALNPPKKKAKPRKKKTFKDLPQECQNML